MASDSVSALGQRLRSLRKERQWTIAAVSKMTGLAASTISKVENGQLSLTYDKLVQLAAGLSLDIAEFFSAPPSAASPRGGVMTRRSVGRKEEGSHISALGYEYWYLNTDIAKKIMIPILGETRFQSIDQFGELISHPGEEVIYVIEGRMAVHTEFYTPTILNPGETIYLDSSMGHAYLAYECEVCRFLCVCTSLTDELSGQVQAKFASLEK